MSSWDEFKHSLSYKNRITFSEQPRLFAEDEKYENSAYVRNKKLNVASRVSFRDLERILRFDGAEKFDEQYQLYDYQGLLKAYVSGVGFVAGDAGLKRKLEWDSK